jgi:hypothetical protein
MSEEKKEEGKHKVRVIEEKIKVSESVNIMKFNADTLNNMSSGSCVISSTIPVANTPSEKIAVCKEGNTIKIFKIVEEKK